MRIEYARSFDKNFSSLSHELGWQCRQAIANFLDAYADRVFPNSLRVHRCGPFISLSINMSYRIFVLPIEDGVRFVFVGDHKAAENYLKRA